MPGDESNLSKIRPRKYPKSVKNCPQICPQGPLGGLLEALGGSWEGLGGLLGRLGHVLARLETVLGCHGSLEAVLGALRPNKPQQAPARGQPKIAPGLRL